MARLFGLLGNRSDLTGRVLAFERDALRVKNSGTAIAGSAVGLGFNDTLSQGDEIIAKILNICQCCNAAMTGHKRRVRMFG